MRFIRITSFVAFVLFAAQVQAADVFTIDPAHSAVEFAVSHMMVSETKGAFKDVVGTIEYDPNDVAATKIDVTIQAKSIDTRVEERDNHLRTSDFLDVENHPTITFKSVLVKEQDGQVVVVGDLTIRGATKRTSFPLNITAVIKHPFDGKMVMGVSGGLTIDRQEFGVAWNKQMDSGGWVVGNDVKISFNVEAKAE